MYSILYIYNSVWFYISWSIKQSRNYAEKKWREKLESIKMESKKWNFNERF